MTPLVLLHGFMDSPRTWDLMRPYLGDEDVRFLNGLDTQLQSGDELSIIPAIAGG